MHRRTACVARLVAATAFVLVVVSSLGVTAQEPRRDVPPAFARQYRDEATAALTRAYNASGQGLFRQLSKTRGNIVMSPYSIGTAMAMALAGARGETEREMASVLAHTLPRAQINDANAAAMAILSSYDKSHVAPACPRDMRLQAQRCEAKPGANGECTFQAKLDGGVCVAPPRYPPSAKLLVANALMLRQTDVAKDYAALLGDKYGAEVFRATKLDAVNDWVSQRTEGKIPKLLEKMSDLVLVNAVYFKSRWALTFDKSNSRDEFFNLSRTRQELVPTMLQRANHAVVAREGYRAIRLPYAVRQLAMVVVLPNEVEGLNAVAERLDTAELSQMLNALKGEMVRPVILTLPRFRTEYTASLKQPFQDAGMRLAFALRTADFSGMTGSSVPAAIDEIVHRAVIEVSEESTEAAVATGVGIQITSAAPRRVEPMPFRVDRPFLYYLVDQATGAVLFQGRIVDPR